MRSTTPSPPERRRGSFCSATPRRFRSRATWPNLARRFRTKRHARSWALRKTTTGENMFLTDRSSSEPPKRKPAIDTNGLTGRIAKLAACQHGYGSRDVLGLPPAFKGYQPLGDKLVILVLGHGGHLRSDDPGSDLV